MGKDRFFGYCGLVRNVGLDDIGGVKDWDLFGMKSDEGRCQEDLKYCFNSLSLSSYILGQCHNL